MGFRAVSGIQFNLTPQVGEFVDIETQGDNPGLPSFRLVNNGNGSMLLQSGDITIEFQDDGILRIRGDGTEGIVIDALEGFLDLQGENGVNINNSPFFPNLPTSPGGGGSLWNDNNTVKVVP